MQYCEVCPARCFQSVDKTLVCDHSNESYVAVLSCGTVHYALQFRLRPRLRSTATVFVELWHKLSEIRL